MRQQERQIGERGSPGTLTVGSLEETTRNEQLLAKTRKAAELQRGTCIKKGKNCEKNLRTLVSSTCLEYCGCCPSLTCFISKGQITVIVLLPKNHMWNQGHHPGWLYRLCLRPHSSAGKQTTASAARAASSGLSRGSG